MVNGVSAEIDRFSWSQYMSVSFYMNKDLEKSLAKTIQGLIAGAEKMQNFSIFRGFPQASFKKM